MPVNADKPQLWKSDAAQSIARYNDWYVRSAPQAYQDARLEAAGQVERALDATAQLTRITPDALRDNPRMLALLRLTTTPPLSRERLSGLAQVPLPVVASMERDGHIPPQLLEGLVEADLQRLGAVLSRMADRDIFPWLEQRVPMTGAQVHRAAMIIADRLCIALADAIIRDAQQERQLTAIRCWLERQGYTVAETTRRLGLDHLRPGTFALRQSVPVITDGRAARGLISIDVAILAATAQPGDLPLLIATQVAGDATRANRKRADDAARVAGLRSTYGGGVRFVLFLGGHFDTGYLGHAAAEGIDWVWEHRIEDLALLVGGTPASSDRPLQERPMVVSTGAPQNVLA